jgi:hypothetical protein
MAHANGAHRYSYAVKASEVVNIPFGTAANMTWDSYWRLAYESANKVIQQQANKLVHRGYVTWEEARQLVEVQRNGLVVEMRKSLTPFGKLYSEALKPSTRLPTLSSLVAEKGSVEAVLVSVGKTRAVTNKIAFVSRVAGPACIALEIVAVCVVIKKAPPQQRAQVATEEIGGAVGGLAGSTAGMWAGAAAGAAWAGTWVSPTLLIPVVGELTEGGAILLGGLFGGWLAHDATKEAIHSMWTLVGFDWR